MAKQPAEQFVEASSEALTEERGTPRRSGMLEPFRS